MTPSAMRILRGALFLSVATFGIVVVLLARAASVPAMQGATARALGYAFYGLVVLSLSGTVVLRGMAEREKAYEKKAVLTLAAWAVAEGAALFGGVVWLLTGAPAPYLAGAALFLIAAFTVPVPEQS